MFNFKKERRENLNSNCRDLILQKEDKIFKLIISIYVQRKYIDNNKEFQQKI